ncbi:uncharacterized protein PG986_004429 [Apiospora aurea]|uniref:Trichothecene 3-O-acetyltransferase-like N-terminal domain-containing protein n=1 Tax=Apiospora aurea TaxID=335848 RepID=A0ABR1QNB0_9PEZI
MEPLHILNQTAPRDYVNFTLCFPFDDDKAQEAVNHLQRCVDDCTQQNPHLTGTLRVQDTPRRNTLAYVPAPPGERRRAVVVEELRPSFFCTAQGGSRSFTYDELRAGGFSPGLFFDDVFAPAGDPADQGGGGRVPVMRVHAIFVPGGLLLGVFIHHAMSDGVVATALINDLAARTRGEAGGSLPKSQHLPLGRPSAEFERRVSDLRRANSGLSSEEIMAEMLPDWTTTTGPDFSIKNCLPSNKSPRVGKIFHFSKDRLAKLSRTLARRGPEGDAVGKPPSTNVALMALIWAYVAKARMRAVGVEDWSALLNEEEEKKKKKNTNDKGQSIAAQLLIVAAWNPSMGSSLASSITKNKTGKEGRKRGSGFSQETLDALGDFCGNAAMCPIAVLPTTQQLWLAAASSSDAPEEQRGTGTGEDAGGARREEALAQIVALITRSLDSLDAEFVRRRAALLETLSDVSAVTMNHDFEAPQNVLFNSHRFLAGPDTVWDIPGLLPDGKEEGEGEGEGEGAVDGESNVVTPTTTSTRGTQRKPEIIRKGRKAWGQGTVLVMPSPLESDVLEVMLAMSGTAMDKLSQDQGWRGWVERIVD